VPDAAYKGQDVTSPNGFRAERERVGQRTFDATVRKARAFQVTGGCCFGYENYRHADGSVRRAINESEAVIVRRIFEMYAGGFGLRAIAHHLNDGKKLAPFAPAWPGGRGAGLRADPPAVCVAIQHLSQRPLN
jgi:recombinase